MRPLPTGAVVFDCDGTLTATEGVWTDAYATVLHRHDLTLSQADRHRLIGVTLGDVGHELARLIGQPDQHRALAAEALGLVRASLAEHVPAMPGAVDLVTMLARTRAIGVASNAERGHVVEYLTKIGVIDLVSVVVGGDDVTAPKPAPDLYLLACERLGVAPDTAVAFEDSTTGARAARTAGLYVIGVPSQPTVRLTDAHVIYPSLADPGLLDMLQPPPRAQRPPRAGRAVNRARALPDIIT